MQIINKFKEYVMGVLIVLSFASYYFDLFSDEMMLSGVIALIIVAYISIIWSERVYDERDEFIRSKVDRFLYILTISIILLEIVYKTFAHESYMFELALLSILSVGKILLSKFIKENN